MHKWKYYEELNLEKKKLVKLVAVTYTTTFRWVVFVNCSHPLAEQQINAVDKVLSELDVSSIPKLMVWNKVLSNIFVGFLFWKLCISPYLFLFPGWVCVSLLIFPCFVKKLRYFVGSAVHPIYCLGRNLVTFFKDISLF